MSARGDCTEFGPFRLFPAERKLLKGDSPVQIGSRALDILIALAERPGEVVTKRELFARVWPDMVVEEGNLRVHVAGLRKLLADGQGQTRYIVNVVGRGYSFVASRAGAAPENWTGALPRRSTRIIGREHDIDTIAELLAEHRFVTIHGPGGVGKTTLGLAVAAAQAHAVADGVCFVDLSLYTRGHTVPDMLASALGLVVNTRDPTPNILDFIRDREMLLVLDSCEPVIDDTAALAESIIDEARSVAILATSREPLRARGEHVYSLEPLKPPPENTTLKASELLAFPAAQLFCERAAASGYRTELGDDEAAIVADICRRVDGNALALELVASRVSTYGLWQTAQLLDSHMKLVWQGRRTGPPRHQTLSAMLDWSHALIGERERAVLRQLSVFVGGFGLDEARAVAGGSDEIVEVLEQLVLKSLVSADTSGQTPRYRLLDTTRTYARAKLVESGTVRETSRRHARYYLDWLTRSPNCAAVPLEHASNIRAALEWAFSDAGDTEIGVGLAACAGELFLRLGMLTESRRWSERALETLPPELAGSLLDMTLRAALGHAMMFTVGNISAVRDALEHALRMAEGLNDPLHQFRLLSGLYMYHRRIGAFEELLPLAERAATIAPAIGGTAPFVAAKAMLGVSHHLNGNLAEAHATLVAVRDAPVDANALVNFYGFHRDAEVLIARTLWLRGFPDQAAQSAHNANRIDERKDPVTACLCLMWGVSVHYLRGDWATTEDYIERILRLASEHALLPFKWFVLALRGDLQRQRGDIATGMSDLREYLRRLREGRYEIYTPWLTCCLAEGLAASDRVDQALSLLNEFDPHPGRRSDVYMPEFLRVRGAVLAQVGDEGAAQHAFQASIAMADTQGALSWRLRTATSQARLLLMKGRLAEARATLAETYGRFTEGFETLDLRSARSLIEEIDARARATPI